MRNNDCENDDPTAVLILDDLDLLRASVKTLKVGTKIDSNNQD